MAKTVAQLRKAHPGKYVFSCTFAAPASDLGDTYCGILPVESDEELAVLVSKFRRLLLDGDELPRRKPPKGMVRVAKKSIKSSSEESE